MGETAGGCAAIRQCAVVDNFSNNIRNVFGNGFQKKGLLQKNNDCGLSENGYQATRVLNWFDRPEGPLCYSA